jgi:hypothetical protein
LVIVKDIVRNQYKKWDDIREEINNIPAVEVACDIRW